MHFICIKSLLSATCCSTLLEWRSAVLNQTSVCQANISAALPICNVTFKSNMSLGTYMHVKDGAYFKSTFWRLISERAFQAEFPSDWVKMVWGIDPCAAHQLGFAVCAISALLRGSSFAVSLQSVSWIRFPVWYILPANSTWAPWAKLSPLYLHALLPAVEGSAGQIYSSLLGDQTSGSSTEG